MPNDPIKGFLKKYLDQFGIASDATAVRGTRAKRPLLPMTVKPADTPLPGPKTPRGHAKELNPQSPINFKKLRAVATTLAGAAQPEIGALLAAPAFARAGYHIAEDLDNGHKLDALDALAATLPALLPADSKIARQLLPERWGLFTAENPFGRTATEAENALHTERAKKTLDAMGLREGEDYFPIKGGYQDEHTGQVQRENGFLVRGLTPEQTESLGRMFNQNSVVTHHGLHDLVDNVLIPSKRVIAADESSPAFSILPNGRGFAHDLDFDQRIPLHQLRGADPSERTQGKLPRSQRADKPTFQPDSVIAPKMYDIAKDHLGLFEQARTGSGPYDVDRTKLKALLKDAGFDGYTDSSYPKVRQFVNKVRPDSVVADAFKGKHPMEIDPYAFEYGAILPDPTATIAKRPMTVNEMANAVARYTEKTNPRLIPAQTPQPRAIPKKIPQNKLTDAEELTYKTLTGKKFLDFLHAGADLKGGPMWYDSRPMQQRAMDALGDDEGRSEFNNLMNMMAATTAMSRPNNNLKRASLWRALADEGRLDPELLREHAYKNVPKGYGHIANEVHQDLLADVLENGGVSPITNPKPASFGGRTPFGTGNLGLNFMPYTNDTRMATATANAEPRLVELGALKRKTGESTFSPNKLYYGAMERGAQRAAHELAGRGLVDVPSGFDPTAIMQAQMWGGIDPSSHAGDINDIYDQLLKASAKLWGVDPVSANSIFWRNRAVLGLPLGSPLLR